jgi:hypothetical protein
LRKVGRQALSDAVDKIEKIATLKEREGLITLDPGHMPFAWIEGCPLLLTTMLPNNCFSSWLLRAWE